jgi:hypothetical protein
MDESIWGSAEVALSAPAAITAYFVNGGCEQSIAFTDFGLKLEPDVGPTSLTQVASFRMQVNVPADQQLMWYVQQLHFGEVLSQDVRLLIVADLAGTVKTIEFDFEKCEFADNRMDALRTVRVCSPQGIELLPLQLGLNGPVADYVATISITMQRRNLKGYGVVQIDGLDVFAVLSPSISEMPPPEKQAHALECQKAERSRS